MCICLLTIGGVYGFSNCKGVYVCLLTVGCVDMFANCICLLFTGDVHTYYLQGMYAEHDGFTKDKPFWSAYRARNYGYNKFHISNSTHIFVEWVSDAY